MLMKFSIASIAAVWLAAAAPVHAADITGTGATFPAPVYAAWAADYTAATGARVNYQGIGSGGGQTQITNRTVDFGASDAPMATDKLLEAKLLQFPAVIGAVVPIINVTGIAANQLKLTGPVLAEIYLGKITKWDDPQIAALNKGVKLPGMAIVPVYRSDGSGTTYVFTDYLSIVSPAWKADVGSATSVKWATGAGAKGNDGVAGMVKNTQGAIGYVEYVYAANNALTTASLRNKSGAFVAPTVASFKSAAAVADWGAAKDFAVSMINAPEAASWPIVSATFILLPTNPKDPAQAAAVMKFFDWSYQNGTATAAKLHYVPLPAAVIKSVRAAWTTSIKSADGKAIYKQP